MFNFSRIQFLAFSCYNLEKNEMEMPDRLNLGIKIALSLN